MLKFIRPILSLLLLLLAFVACKTQKQASHTAAPPAAAPRDSTIQALPDTIRVAGPADTAVVDTVPVIPQKDSLVITGVGDIMLGTNFPETYYLPPNEGKDMLAGVAHVFAGADVVFGNLEGVILDSAGTQKKCRNPKACYLFRSPSYMANRLHEAGFNLLSVANNHAGDFGPEGRAHTAKMLDSLGIHYAGNLQQPFIVFAQEGIKYGFAAFSPNKGTPQITDIARASATVAHLDSLCDVVIVSFHGGAEGNKYTSVPRAPEYFYGEDRGDVYHFAHAMVDAGADIIFGHGPHVPRAIEVYQGRFIAYSLGNFATYGRFNLRGVNGLAPIARIVVSNRGEFLTGRIISARQVGWGIPEIDPENAAARLIEELSKKDLPESVISIDESGIISYLHP